MSDDRRPDCSAGSNRWDATDYDRSYAFVHEYSESVLDLLDPRPGERVLDLGCGTGHLTAELAEAVGDDGDVVGIDQDAEMVVDAREHYPEVQFERADATGFVPQDRFDAVFSNAALHWVDDQDAVTGRVRDALVPGGRFVAELGGHGNVARIVDAVVRELHDRGHEAGHPWYFPTIGEHTSRLERHGFEVRLARLFDRPTELDGGADGLKNWLEMFGDSWFGALTDSERRDVIGAVEASLRDDLFDAEATTWTADYRRLRFEAVHLP